MKKNYFETGRTLARETLNELKEGKEVPREKIILSLDNLLYEIQILRERKKK